MDDTAECPAPSYDANMTTSTVCWSGMNILTSGNKTLHGPKDDPALPVFRELQSPCNVSLSPTPIKLMNSTAVMMWGILCGLLLRCFAASMWYLCQSYRLCPRWMRYVGSLRFFCACTRLFPWWHFLALGVLACIRTHAVHASRANSVVQLAPCKARHKQ